MKPITRLHLVSHAVSGHELVPHELGEYCRFVDVAELIAHAIALEGEIAKMNEDNKFATDQLKEAILQVDRANIRLQSTPISNMESVISSLMSVIEFHRDGYEHWRGIKGQMEMADFHRVAAERAQKTLDELRCKP